MDSGEHYGIICGICGAIWLYYMFKIWHLYFTNIHAHNGLHVCGQLIYIYGKLDKV